MFRSLRRFIALKILGELALKIYPKKLWLDDLMRMTLAVEKRAKRFETEITSDDIKNFTSRQIIKE